MARVLIVCRSAEATAGMAAVLRLAGHAVEMVSTAIGLASTLADRQLVVLRVGEGEVDGQVALWQLVLKQAPCVLVVSQASQLVHERYRHGQTVVSTLAEPYLLEAFARTVDGLLKPATVPAAWVVEGADRPAGWQRLERLSPREREVLHLLVLGTTNKRLAIQLGVTVKGIERCLTRLYTKLAVTSRGQAIAFALHAGVGADANSTSSANLRLLAAPGPA